MGMVDMRGPSSTSVLDALLKLDVVGAWGGSDPEGPSNSGSTNIKKNPGEYYITLTEDKQEIETGKRIIYRMIIEGTTAGPLEIVLDDRKGSGGIYATVSSAGTGWLLIQSQYSEYNTTHTLVVERVRS